MVASDPTLSQRDISDLLGLDPNNAGFATQGRFETIPAGLHRDQIRLNVLAVVELCHALAPAMVERRRGGDRAVYGASKAFVLSFSQALSAELRGRGIRVLALCPGPVNTQFFDVLGSDDAAIGQTLSAEEVVGRARRAVHRPLGAGARLPQRPKRPPGPPRTPSARARNRRARHPIGHHLTNRQTPKGNHRAQRYVLVIEPGAYQTALGANATEAAGFGPEHPQRPGYQRFWETIDTTLHPDGRADPQEVVDAILDAIDHPDGPFRRLVGRDAKGICDLKRENTSEHFEAAIQSTLGLDPALIDTT